MIITIDGPAAAGKTTMAKAIAAVKHMYYVDTGAFYRVLAVAMERLSLSEEDVANVPHIHALSRDNKQYMFFNDTMIPEKELRTEQISQKASKISAIPEIRGIINSSILDFISGNNCILEGRDTGTVIAPDADAKFYLTADQKTRAERRYIDLCLAGNTVDISNVLSDLKERDERDTTRKIAPLQYPENALYIDNTELSAYECLQLMFSCLKEVE